jgi:hypothetical protein
MSASDELMSFEAAKATLRQDGSQFCVLERMEGGEKLHIRVAQDKAPRFACALARAGIVFTQTPVAPRDPDPRLDSIAPVLDPPPGAVTFELPDESQIAFYAYRTEFPELKKYRDQRAIAMGR